MKIGQAAAASGISEQMIRHDEKCGLVPQSARRYSGYREHDERDVRTLKFVGHARDIAFRLMKTASCSCTGVIATGRARS